MFKLMNKDRDPDRYPELKWSHQDSLLLHVTHLYTTKTGAAAGFSLLLCVKTTAVLCRAVKCHLFLSIRAEVANAHRDRICDTVLIEKA